MLSVCDRREHAALALEGRDTLRAPAEVVDVLDLGLGQLRDLFVDRLHDDVEVEFGLDSMLAPSSLTSEVKQVRGAQNEADAYACFLVADQALRYDYVAEPGGWLEEWALRLRLGDNAEFGRARVEAYGELAPKDRHTAFVSLLLRALPEGRKAPGVLFHLYTRGVKIVAALAFGHPQRARELRAQQREMLSVIAECPECQGDLLEPDQLCETCGNPLWTYAWLRAF